jgi:hypothetical protein
MLEAKPNILRPAQAVDIAADFEAVPLADRRIGVAKGHFAVPVDIDTENEAIEMIFSPND